MRVPKDQAIFEQFTWEVISIEFHLEKIRHIWAKACGVSSPQWLILMALINMDKGEGVSVKSVSNMLHVDPSFVTTQTKILEKHGLVRRDISEKDARFVRMSLTDRAYKRIASLASQRERLNEFIFIDFDETQIAELTGQLQSLKVRLDKARLKVAIET
ncbi:MarR family transcriptional regulator [Bradyrhizobium nitroreducens]|uniref:MarR family transcriptional regulator n=2 Tax=Bradyrhizobium nitroreducens TaxID=709803 RepID=A0A2M6U8B8_9BRAD|nr:MarR family transcriptional regulator [Bradyrhizobium nitroreducens]